MQYGGIPNMNHDTDCGMIDVCERLGFVYNLCHKGASIHSARCSPGQKQTLLVLAKIHDQLTNLTEKLSG